MDEKMIASAGGASKASQVPGVSNLDDAVLRIKELETRLKELEYRIPKKYPEIKFLTYKDRKRILVSTYLYDYQRVSVKFQ